MRRLDAPDGRCSTGDSARAKEKAAEARKRKDLFSSHGRKVARAMQQKNPRITNLSMENDKERTARLLQVAAMNAA